MGVFAIREIGHLRLKQGDLIQVWAFLIVEVITGIHPLTTLFNRLNLTDFES